MTAARNRLIVFDCDGTLVDSQHTIIGAMAAAWAAEGLAPPAADAVRSVVGLPLPEAITRILPDGQRDRHDRLVRGYQIAFRRQLAQGRHDEPLFPGVPETLDLLEEQGFLLGVATGKGRTGLDRTLARHGLGGRFVTLQTSDIAPGKPNPDMLYRAMDETGTEPDDTVMVGDTSFDIEMAVNARVAGVGVEWGYHPPEALRAAGAVHMVSSFAALPLVIDAVFEGRP